MFRSRGENLHSVFVFLFLTIAFFLLEYQDAAKYARLFSFDRDAVMGGEIWRLFTFQFTQSGQGWLAFPRPLVLFFTLLLLYLMGDALEEAWGTRHFLILFCVSTLTAAGVAAYLAIPLLASYFVNFTLLFVYASAFPRQTFYLFNAVPIRVQWLAVIAALLLVFGVVAGGAANTAAFAGAAAGYLYFLSQRVRLKETPEPDSAPVAETPESIAVRNAARFVGIKRAVTSRSLAEVDRLRAQFEREIVAGVNVCPPVDYKPEHTDGYCIRCEGFAECSARYLALHRPEPTATS
jgi:membrane associated rhomboid family serine protease